MYMKNKAPDWFKKSAVYQINPRTFCQEGTIQAVTKQLPVLAELGFKIMYLCPIFQEDDSEDRQNWSTRQKASQTGNPKNPYRMNDYFQVDSEYGTMDDLREFVQKSHGLGMRVILDLEIPWRRAWQPTPLFLPGESPWTQEPGGLQSMGSQRV